MSNRDSREWISDHLESCKLRTFWKLLGELHDLQALKAKMGMLFVQDRPGDISISHLAATC